MEQTKEIVEDYELSIPELVVKMNDLLEAAEYETIKEIFEDLLPFDMFTIYEDLSIEKRKQLIEILPVEELAAIFAQYDEYAAADHLAEIETKEAANILAEMNSDDAVEIFKVMPRQTATSYITYMPEDEAREIHKLLFYDDNSAGSIMAFGMITILASDTVKAAMKKVVDKAPDAHTVNVIFVLDDEDKLVGVLSLRDLIIARKPEIIADIMQERVITIKIDEDREIASQLMQDYDLTVLPVVNDLDELEGIITIDDIVDVIREEAEEDYYKMAGISEEENPAASSDYQLLPSMKKRLPWLVSMIFLSILVSTIIGAYQNNFASEIIVLLTPFITMVNNMTGVPGIQVAAVTMLRVVSGEIKQDKKLMRSFLLNQMLTAVLVGLIIGVIVATCAYILTALLGKENITIFFVIALAVFLSSVISSLIGIFSVLFLDKMGKDPAVASGPFMSTIGDMIGVVVYFTVAMGVYSIFR